MVVLQLRLRPRGRIVEHLTRSTWDAALRELLVQPLGLTATVTLPEDALLHRTAVGHVGEPEDDPVPASTWMLPRSAGPAGLISARVADVLAFARMHLAGGVAAGGERVLSAASAAAMTAEEVRLPDTRTLGDSWGLGWIRYGWDAERLLGHDGNTLGQAAFLRVLLSRGIAVALLANGGHTLDLSRDLFGEVFTELAGVGLPAPLAPADDPVADDPAAYVGRYERAGLATEVFQGDDGLVLRSTVTGPLASSCPSRCTSTRSRPSSRASTRCGPRDGDLDRRHVLRARGRARYVHYGARATPLLDD